MMRSSRSLSGTTTSRSPHASTAPTLPVDSHRNTRGRRTRSGSSRWAASAFRPTAATCMSRRPIGCLFGNPECLTVSTGALPRALSRAVSLGDAAGGTSDDIRPPAHPSEVTLMRLLASMKEVARIRTSHCKNHPAVAVSAQRRISARPSADWSMAIAEAA
jgi:hypothetical protein